MAGASFPARSAAPRTRHLSRVRHDGGVYPGVYTGVYGVIPGYYRSKRPEPTFYLFLPHRFYVCFTSVLAPFYAVLHRFYVKQWKRCVKVIKTSGKVIKHAVTCGKVTALYFIPARRHTGDIELVEVKT